MRLTVRSIILVAVVFVGLFAAARFFYVQLALQRVGETSESPDGQHRAEIRSYYGPSFLGGDRGWLEVRIVDLDSEEVLWEHRLDDPQRQLMVRERFTSIEWTPQSDQVTFTSRDADNTAIQYIVRRSGEGFERVTRPAEEPAQ